MQTYCISREMPGGSSRRVSLARRKAEDQRITVTLPDELAQELVRESEIGRRPSPRLVRKRRLLAKREPEGVPEFVGMVEDDDPMHPSESMSLGRCRREP